MTAYGAEHSVSSFFFLRLTHPVAQDQISCVEPKLFASRFLKYMRDKLRSLPSSEMRTLSDLQQAASSMHEESEFGMLTPRRQYHRQLQLELEGKIPAKEPTARPPPSPRFAVPAPAQADNELSSSDSSSSESEEPSSSQHSEASGASGASGGHHRHHKKRHHKHRHHHGHHKPQNTSLLSVSPATSSPLKEKALEHRDGKSEKSDKSDSKSSDKSKSESKSEKKDK